MERAKAKACSESRTRARIPKEYHTEEKWSIWRALFLPPHLSNASKPDSLGWDSLPFNPVGVSNSQTHKGDLLHATSPSQTAPVLLQHHSGQGEASRKVANGQKEKKKRNLICHSSGCRTEAPMETLAHSTDLSPLDISREDADMASLKQIPSYSSVCQVGQVSNPMGLSALKCLCEWLLRTP